MNNKIITGEIIQQLCNIYLGYNEDFNYNPIIKNQKEKHIDLNNLNTEFDNPYLIFCYSHRILELSNKIHLFKNKFILFSHNSDDEIKNCSYVLKILNCDNLDKWFAQNICFEYNKLFFLPIGIANSQWNHGNLSIFYNNKIMDNLTTNKNKQVYFNFNINTNRQKRQICYDILKSKLEWLNNVEPVQNLIRLANYKFAICPEGNGCDTVRLWESLYLHTVPIVIKSDFSEILKKNNIPILILDNWTDFDINNLDYSKYDFKNFQIPNSEYIFSLCN